MEPYHIQMLLQRQDKYLNLKDALSERITVKFLNSYSNNISYWDHEKRPMGHIA